jgi:hypothetical protein
MVKNNYTKLDKITSNRCQGQKKEIKLEGFYINFTNKKVENEHKLDDNIV